MSFLRMHLFKAMLLCSCVFAFNVSAQTFEVKPVDWLSYSESSYEVNSKYIQSAMTDGAMYTLPAPTQAADMHPESPANQQCTKGYKIYKSGSSRESIIAEYFSGGSALEHYPVKRSASEKGEYYYMGPAIAADDAGTLWTHTMRGDAPGTDADWRVGFHTFTYYTERPARGVPGTKKTFNLDPSGNWMTGKAYLMSACGDGANGVGYIWVAAESTRLARYTIKNGFVTAKELFNSPLANGINPANPYTFVKQYAGNKIIYSTAAYDEVTGTMKPQSIYRGTLSADGKSITWDATPVVTDSYSPQVAVFTLADHEILVYNSLDESYDYSPYREITIYDMTAKKVISSHQPVFVPSKNNYIRQSLNVVAIDECNAYIYGFIPGVGVYRYPIVATPEGNPVTNINVECEDNWEYLGRQDAAISWKAPASAQSYIVYYKSSYINGAGETISSDWVKVGETTNTSITHDDVCWATVLENDDRKYYQRSYTYKVIPVYANGTLGKEAISSTLIPDFMPSAPIWVDVNPVKDNRGYCIVQLLWNEWHGYGCQPHHYNVIRDDEVINYRNGELLEIGGSNYVDTTCVSGATYRYRIEAAYPNVTIPERYANYTNNEDISVSIATRDWSKPRYSISKVYEYKIVGKEGDDYAGYDGYVLPDAQEFPNFHSEPDCYRQGVFYNGCWYISQYTNDNTAERFQHDPQLVSTTLKGGVLRFLGDDPREEIPDDKVKYPSTYPQVTVGVYADNTIERRPLVSYHRENQCIAVDKSGTFLTRGLRTGWTGVLDSWEDNNNYALACSSIEFHNFDKNWHGSFDLPTALVQELEASAVEESLRVNDPTLPGRVDYFSAQGDLYNDGWCYLYMAPMVSKTAFRVKLVRSGSSVMAENWIKFTENGTNPDFTYAQENYAFPVNCVDRKGEEYVHEQLGNVYSLQSGDGTTQKELASERAIYETSTFLNTIGGVTFEFNNELFFVAPQGQFPGNTGSFLVGMANRFTENIDGSWTNNGAPNADMTDIIPTAQWYTGKANTDVTETNGLWIHAEQAKNEDGTIIDENKDGMTDYAYIYTYRPGLMFGKYILRPNTLFPPTQVKLSVDPVYKTDDESGKNIDILQYDATASWNEVQNYATSGGSFYQIQGYTMSIYDVEERDNGAEDGNDGLLATISFDLTGDNAVTLNADGTISDALGNIIEGLTYETYTVEENGVMKDYHTFKYIYTNVDAIDDNGEKRDFIAYVTVNYEGDPSQESTAGKLFDSAQTEYIAANSYLPEPPAGLTKIYKETYILTEDTDGDEVVDTKYQYYYNFMNPKAPVTDEPVTHYTITVQKGEDQETLNRFAIYDPEGKYFPGKEIDADGYVILEATTDENGNVIPPTIPGNYDFEAAAEALSGGGMAKNGVIKWVVKDEIAAVETNEDGETLVYEDKDGDNAPLGADGVSVKWQYYVNAHFADTNPYIRFTTQGGTTESGGTFTGVDSPMFSTEIAVYPNPADSYITVESPSEIGKLMIISADGRVVKSFDVEDSKIVINIDDLASGVYFVRANGISKMLIKK